ncbi:hypothetical protein C0J52_15754, partial [Blattella germanica]
KEFSGDLISTDNRVLFCGACEKTIGSEKRFQIVVGEIRDDIGSSYFWLSVDESTDCCMRQIANVVIGKLDSEATSRPHLIATRIKIKIIPFFVFLLKVVQGFDGEAAVAITEAKEVLSSPSIKGDLAYIKANFGNIPVAITKLETRGILLLEAIDIVTKVQQSLGKVVGEVGEAVASKVTKVLNRNPG